MRPVPRIIKVSPVNTRSGMMKLYEVIGVPWRIGDIQTDPLDAKPIAIRDAHGHHVDARLLAHDSDALRAIPQRPKPGDMIGVQVRIDRLHQLQVEFAHQLQVAIDLLQHRIDDQRLTATARGEHVGVGAGRRIEELTEDHDRLQIAAWKANSTIEFVCVATNFCPGTKTTTGSSEPRCLPRAG